MTPPDTHPERTYGPVAIALHWLVFALVTAQMLVGWFMPDIKKNTPQEGLVDLHLSLGAATMLVVLVRIVWRVMRPTPLTTTMTGWERVLAKLTHELLYLLLLVIPLLGWAAAGFRDYTVRLFGIPLPPLADHTMQWAHTAGDIHMDLTYVLLGLVGLHALAALWHYFVRKDQILQRMIPALKRR